jgi:uncharacterized membrane-anchored protein
MLSRWLVLLAVLPTAAAAQKLQETPRNLTPAQLEARLHYQTGRVALRGGLATLDLPTQFRYLDPHETDIVLRTWGNPPNQATLGMIVPAQTGVFRPESWAVVISYDEDGFVKDNDAATVNYDQLLRKMQEALRDANAERRRQGYPEIELVGWAEPPRYDSAAHKLFWAKELRFGTEPTHTLNYNVRVLGRRGVLVLNAVAGMDQLAAIRRDMGTVMRFVEFTGGNRYADFVPGTDKVAEYGIAALIAGSIAAKAGLFKVLLAGILALKKLLIVALAAVAAFFKRLFGRKKQVAPAPTSS